MYVCMCVCVCVCVCVCACVCVCVWMGLIKEKMGVCVGERFGRGIVTDAITTPVVNTSAYFFKKTSELIDFKVCGCGLLYLLV